MHLHKHGDSTHAKKTSIFQGSVKKNETKEADGNSDDPPSQSSSNAPDAPAENNQ